MMTCAGLGDGGNFLTAFPHLAYVQIAADNALPFADQEFDVVFSNAVLDMSADANNAGVSSAKSCEWDAMLSSRSPTGGSPSSITPACRCFTSGPRFNGAL
ncbi:MAG: methyltransferase domain-containing protein [Methyloceanibacter sp.]